MISVECECMRKNCNSWNAVNAIRAPHDLFELWN